MPFCLGDLAHHGRSGHLYDNTTRAFVKTKPSGLKDQINLDDLKVYVPQAEQGSKEGEAGSVLECIRMGWKGRGAVCNRRGSLTLGSEPELMDEGVGAWTDKDKTWGNRQGKDVALRRNNC